MDTLLEIKIKAISRAMKRNKGNKYKTARELDISPKTIRKYCQKYPNRFPIQIAPHKKPELSEMAKRYPDTMTNKWGKK